MKVLIACIGNIFCGDDGFGIEVARVLSKRTLPEGVVLRDFAILVDACPRGGAPGTVYVIEPEIDTQRGDLDPHSMNPVNVLRMVRSLGGASCPILLVGCEPEDSGPEEGKMGLTPAVSAAVKQAADRVELLIAEARIER